MPNINAIDWTTEESLLLLSGWARDGLTDKQIAEHKIGISERTLCRWKNDYPSILAALKKGKEPVDREVENALLKRALGYEYEETTTEIHDCGNGKIEKHIRTAKRSVAPDVTAQIFWLKNRKPEQWREKREITDTAANEKLDAILDEIKKDALQ